MTVKATVADVVHADVADIAEGPCWRPPGRLTWVDVLDGRVNVADVRDAVAVVERHTLDVPVSAALPMAAPEDGWILAAGGGFAHLAADGAVRMLAQPELAKAGVVRMNDAKCDPLGRLWAGSMAYDESPGMGSLFRVDLDGSVTRVREGLQISNGIDWSPDGRTFYFNDSGHGVVYAAPYDLDRGEIGPLRPLVAPEGGAPDGLTVDAEGMIWVALWQGGAVHRYDPAGRLVERVEVAAQLTTSCCLGGSDGRTLFITTATRGLTDAELRAEPDCGRLFAATVDVPGPPTATFLGALPEPPPAGA
jgi:sugar lactone lactonase YvrE